MGLIVTVYYICQEEERKKMGFGQTVDQNSAEKKDGFQSNGDDEKVKKKDGFWTNSGIEICQKKMMGLIVTVYQI